MIQDIHKTIHDLVHYLHYSRDLTRDDLDMAVQATSTIISNKMVNEFALQDKIFCLAVENTMPPEIYFKIFTEFENLLKDRETIREKIKSMTN